MGIGFKLKPKVKGRGYTSNADGTIAVTCLETGKQLALTHDEYREWCVKQGKTCPLDK